MYEMTFTLPHDPTPQHVLLQMDDQHRLLHKATPQIVVSIKIRGAHCRSQAHNFAATISPRLRRGLFHARYSASTPMMISSPRSLLMPPSSCRFGPTEYTRIPFSPLAILLLCTASSYPLLRLAITSIAAKPQNRAVSVSSPREPATIIPRHDCTITTRSSQVCEASLRSRL